MTFAASVKNNQKKTVKMVLCIIKCYRCNTSCC